MNKFIRAFFWFAFAAFLAASIPHVAYFFRAYEPTDTSIVWELVSYGIALSIDVTIFLLSVTVAGMRRQHKSAGLIFSVWIFIIGLAALSWYINFKYAAHFIDTGMVSPTQVTLPFLGTIADINPVIASMFQILAIAYTWISDKIAADEQVKSAAELEDEAAELERKVAAKKRINSAKNEGLSAWIAGKKQILSEALSEQKLGETSPTFPAIPEQLSPEIVAKSEEDFAGDLEQNTETFEPEVPANLTTFPLHERLESTLVFIEKHPDYIGDWSEERERELADFLGLERPASARFWRLKAEWHLQETGRQSLEVSTENEAMTQAKSSRKYLMTFEEASRYTGYSISYLKAQVTKKEIEVGQSGKLKVSSLKVKSGNTGEVPALKAVQ